PTTVIYTLSLHDALPIYRDDVAVGVLEPGGVTPALVGHDSVDGLEIAEVVVLELHAAVPQPLHLGGHVADEPVHDRVLRRAGGRSEEHTSELQSRSDLVC